MKLTAALGLVALLLRNSWKFPLYLRMPAYSSLVANISTLTQMNRAKYVPGVLNDPRLRGRMMFGTDHPLTNTPMVTPLQYPLRLTLAQLWDLWTTRNPWDRSVKLKAALGVPPDVFTKGREYLGLYIHRSP